MKPGVVKTNARDISASQIPGVAGLSLIGRKPRTPLELTLSLQIASILVFDGQLHTGIEDSD